MPILSPMLITIPRVRYRHSRAFPLSTVPTRFHILLRHRNQWTNRPSVILPRINRQLPRLMDKIAHLLTIAFSTLVNRTTSNAMEWVSSSPRTPIATHDLFKHRFIGTYIPWLLDRKITRPTFESHRAPVDTEPLKPKLLHQFLNGR